MSDEALAWKIAFGALVLAFCGVAYFTRAPAHPVEVVKGAPPPAAAPASIPLPPFEVIPPDVPDADEPQQPQAAQLEAPEPRAREAAKPRKSARRVPASKVHLVRHRVRSSPHASGRKHYPFDPKERWVDRYA